MKLKVALFLVLSISYAASAQIDLDKEVQGEFESETHFDYYSIALPEEIKKLYVYFNSTFGQILYNVGEKEKKPTLGLHDNPSSYYSKEVFIINVDDANKRVITFGVTTDSYYGKRKVEYKLLLTAPSQKTPFLTPLYSYYNSACEIDELGYCYFLFKTSQSEKLIYNAVNENFSKRYFILITWLSHSEYEQKSTEEIKEILPTIDNYLIKKEINDSPFLNVKENSYYIFGIKGDKGEKVRLINQENIYHGSTDSIMPTRQEFYFSACEGEFALKKSALKRYVLNVLPKEGRININDNEWNLDDYSSFRIYIDSSVQQLQLKQKFAGLMLVRERKPVEELYSLNYNNLLANHVENKDYTYKGIIKSNATFSLLLQFPLDTLVSYSFELFKTNETGYLTPEYNPYLGVMIFSADPSDEERQFRFSFRKTSNSSEAESYDINAFNQRYEEDKILYFSEKQVNFYTIPKGDFAIFKVKFDESKKKTFLFSGQNSNFNQFFMKNYTLNPKEFKSDFNFHAIKYFDFIRYEIETQEETVEEFYFVILNKDDDKIFQFFLLSDANYPGRDENNLNVEAKLVFKEGNMLESKLSFTQVMQHDSDPVMYLVCLYDKKNYETLFKEDGSGFYTFALNPSTKCQKHVVKDSQNVNLAVDGIPANDSGYYFVILGASLKKGYSNNVYIFYRPVFAKAPNFFFLVILIPSCIAAAILLGIDLMLCYKKKKPKIKADEESAIINFVK